MALPQNQEIIHTIARNWIVDGQSEVQHPLGMSAYRLEVDAHIVTGSTTALSNTGPMRARPQHRHRRTGAGAAGRQ